MLAMPDLVTAYVINAGLEHLAANPDQCHFILGAFAKPPLARFVNKDHINQAVELITSKKISVAPYYELDIKQRPSVGIVCSGTEDIQFIGDIGGTRTAAVFPPTVYADFDVKTIDGDMIYVPEGLHIEKQVLLGSTIVNGAFSATLKAIKITPGQDTGLWLDTAVPAGTPYLKWRSQSLPRVKGYEILSSMDKVTIQVNLLTTGQASVHRLIALVIRYCLKRGRQYFDQYGLQVPTFSYTPLICTDDTELEYQSTFTAETKVLDSWVYREFEPPEGFDISVVAESINTEEQDVVLK